MKQLNIANILANCPAGRTLYSVDYGNVKIDKVDKTTFDIITSRYNGKIFLIEEYDKYGKKSSDGECLLFPSKDCDWDTWQAFLIKVGDYIKLNNGKVALCVNFKSSIDILTNNGIIKPIDVDNVAGWASEDQIFEFNKMLEENENKYKQSEIVFKKKTKTVEEVNFELQPFDKVLVRDTDNEKWECDFYKRPDSHTAFNYKCFTSSWNQCIPYNDETKHLIRTTEKAPAKYIIWKEE